MFIRTGGHSDNSIFCLGPGTKHLLPVNNKIIPIRYGGDAYGRGIRAGCRFANRNSQSDLPPDNPGNIVILLLFGAMFKDIKPAKHSSNISTRNIIDILSKGLGR